MIVAAVHANPVLSTERRPIGRTRGGGAFPVVGFKASAPNQPDIDPNLVALAYAGKAGDGAATEGGSEKIFRHHSRAFLSAPLERYSIMLTVLARPADLGGQAQAVSIREGRRAKAATF
jgi:hypothetical protein